MKDQRRQQREARQQEGEEPRVPAQDDGDGAPDFERDHQRQQRAGHAHGLHVALGSGVAADLLDAGDQEHGGQEDAAGEVGEVLRGVHGVGVLCV
jgi:hypothetical protein